MLEIESQRARYFEQLLLKRAGIVVPDEYTEPVEYQPVIQRAGKLSEIRRMAELLTKNKAHNPVASQEELTEAEKIFEQQLGAH